MVGWHHWLCGHEFEQLQELVKDWGTWCAAVHGVTKSQTRLRDWTTANTYLTVLSFLNPERPMLVIPLPQSESQINWITWPTLYIRLSCPFLLKLFSRNLRNLRHWKYMKRKIILFKKISNFIEIKLCKFKVYNVLIWYTCILQYDYHYNHTSPSLHISTISFLQWGHSSSTLVAAFRCII